jgi:hypothetical protein
MTPVQRATRYLASLRRWTQRLRWFAEVWGTPELDERERQAFPLEWDNAIDGLIDVEEMAQAGDLRKDALAELHAIAEELTELLPTMRRLHLRLPDLEALERARAVEAA